MTATLTAPPVPDVTVRVLPGPGADQVRVLAERAGLGHGTGEYAPGAVTVVVAPDPEQALRGVGRRGPLLLVCDTVGGAGRLRALRAGAVVLARADLTEETLVKAVHRAAHPHQSIPYPELSRLLTGVHPARRVPVSALTARQTSVLRLMAEGHGNADIALQLTCSEHTVKNAIYEIMARLQARNRAHAVAHAVRHGLV
ncbi:LuxR C-terminal-related transcriptional regulator [Streptomyces sp. NPDC048002]|uniref:helix-turn-helix transcriptional regulator n=1 Tax=Streptomyces sp. NPDC048002 TaxID=3154344 RepID=UPI0033DA7F3B